MIRIKHLPTIIVFLTMLIPIHPVEAQVHAIDEPESVAGVPQLTFPENYVSVMKHWITEQDLEFHRSQLSWAKELLDLQGRRLTDRERKARKRAYDTLKAIEKLWEAYDHLLHEEFTLTLGDVDYVSQFIRSLATEHRDYAVGIDLYRSAFDPLPAAPESSQGIDDFFQDITSGYLEYFVLDMLRGETYFRLGAYQKAVDIYRSKLFPRTVQGRTREISLDSGEYLDFLRADAEGPLEEDKLKMIRIRLAFTYLAWGDRIFKRSYGLPDQEKQEVLDDARDKYEEALRLFPDARMAQRIDERINDLSTVEDDLIADINARRIDLSIPSNLQRPIEITWENPLIIQIVCHAKMQILKIDKGLNYLGYTDGYVPDQRYITLYNHAREYADSAIEVENRYIQFKKEGEEQEYLSQQLGQNLQIAGYQKQIAQTRGTIAQQRMEQADVKTEAIDEQIKAIEAKIEAAESSGFWESVASGVSMVASVAAAPMTGGASLALGALAYGATVAGEMARHEALEGTRVSGNHEIAALEHEKRAVAIDKTIAAKEGLIADLEATIADMQQTFIKENMNYLARREMNQEIYYALAKTLRQIKEKYLEAGIRMGFLAERALVFEMGKSDLRFIKLDYEDSALKGLLAGDFLKQDLAMMEYDRVLSLKQRNHVKHVISLRQRYPMEFASFIQTGVMGFVTGLYDFDKAHPGTYQRRLKRVEVAIQGIIGPEGFKGSLTNFGTFVVRSKDRTMLPEVTRLLPTEEELQNAYQNLGAEGLSIIPVGGVNAFELPPARLVLSRYDIRQDQVIFGSETEVRELFEGFGVSGLWRLELPKNVNDADYRTIADVKLILYFDALYDPELEKKIGGYYEADWSWVDGLVQEYEREVSGGEELDQVVTFSLRQHFPDEFFSLTSGKVEFELLEGDFPLYMIDKKVKKVMVLAVDQEGRGVGGIGLRIAKLSEPILGLPGTRLRPGEDTFIIERTDVFPINANTNADGFAVDGQGYMDPNSANVFPQDERVYIVGTWSIELTDPSQASEIDDLLVLFAYEYKERGARIY